MVPFLSYRPSSNAPRVEPSLDLRHPITTQSAVRWCLIFTQHRLPGTYGPFHDLAMTPSSPAPSNFSNHSSAFFGSRVYGVRKIGRLTPFRSFSSRLRRSPNGCLRRSMSPSASRSKATNQAGVASLSIRTRDSAGWTLCCRAPKSSPLAPTTITSPSSTSLDCARPRKAGSSSGKYLVIGLPPRLIRATSSPSRYTSVRKPSHLGSYSQLSPFGMPVSEIADSIGSISSGRGDFRPVIPRCLYLVDDETVCYHIVCR